MAASELLATADTAASSPDIVLADGESAIVALKGNEIDAVCHVEIKDDDAAYSLVARLDYYNAQRMVLGPATYRVRRLAGAACGVFSA